MTWSRFFKIYGVALVTFLAIDALWLKIMAGRFYEEQLGDLMRADVNWVAAVVFYLLFVTGIVILVLQPALEQRSPVRALVHGALLGLVAYAAYDLTSLAVLEGFPWIVAVVDMAWGTVLCATVSFTTFSVIRRVAHRESRATLSK